MSSRNKIFRAPWVYPVGMKISAILPMIPRWGRRLLLSLASLLLLYTILGFFVVPRVIKSKLPPKLAQTLGREVTLGKVRTNPFTLSATLEDFQIRDRGGEAFLGCERLYVNLSLSTLFTHTVSFQSIELVRPFGRIIVKKEGGLNFSDILDRLEKEQSAKGKTDETPWEIAIGYLAIRGAKATLLDRSLSEPFATTLGPVTVELSNFQTKRNSRNPYAFSGRTESGETFSWTGVFSTEPLKSQGTLAIERLVLSKYQPYYKDQVAFDLKDGLASMKASYTFQWSAGVHVLQLQDGSLEVQNLKLAEIGETQNAVELPALELRGLQADLITQRVEIGSLVARNGSLDVVRLPNGELSLVKLLTPKPHPKPEEAEKPFHLRLKELGLRDFRVAFLDQSTVRPVKTLAENINITLRDFTLDPGASAKLTASLTLDGRARIEADGTVAPLRATADLTIKLAGLELTGFDPYLDPALDVRVNHGLLSLAGRLRVAAEGRPSDFVAFKGNVHLEQFEAMDGAQQEPFLRYKDLRLTSLDLRTNPKSMSIQNMDLVESEHRLVISKDGSTNVARAFKTQAPPAVSRAGAVLGSVVPSTPSEAYKVAIAKLSMQGGRLSFIDRSLEPNAALFITDLEGTNTGLSTEPEGSSTLDLKGKVGALAPLSIHGYSMPLRRDQDTDVTVRIQGADLSDFSPYTGKFLGYTVRKGKLDLDAHIKIEQRKLKALVAMKMDQFFLGDKTESPDATQLPINLALALLRDRKGLIALELPVDGNLDDPAFHYGQIAWNALLNVLGKIATSPFTLIGNLFGGGGEDLSFVAYVPGAWEPDTSARKRAEVLAKALIERPDLSLEVEGTADPNADGMALKKLALERVIRNAMVKSLQAKNPALDPETITILPEERPQWLTVTFDAAFPPPKEVTGKPKTPPPPPAEMEQRLLGTLTVNANELRELADRRTKAMVKALLEGGKVEAHRVFKIEGGERAKKEGGSRVYFGLK